jgi:hypothetical protein
MAVLSTMRFEHTSSSHHHSHLTECPDNDQMETNIGDSLAQFSPSNKLVSSILHVSNVALSIGNLFGDDDHGHRIHLRPAVDPWGDKGCGKAPVDGPEIWFCSECGDGPLGDWFEQCTSCDHIKCIYCKVEKAG